jgi:proteic killer suppression protein
VIKSWQHKGLKKFYDTGSKAGIQAHHSNRLKIILQRLDAAIMPTDLNTPGMDFHSLKGNKKGFFSVSVSGNWRVIFGFIGNHATLVDYLDYH